MVDLLLALLLPPVMLGVLLIADLFESRMAQTRPLEEGQTVVGDWRCGPPATDQGSRELTA